MAGAHLANGARESTGTPADFGDCGDKDASGGSSRGDADACEFVGGVFESLLLCSLKSKLLVGVCQGLG